MRLVFVVLLFAGLVAAALVVGCGGKPVPCAEPDQICGSDGVIYCRLLPFNLTPIDMECCPKPLPGRDAATTPGLDATTAGPDAAIAGPDAAQDLDATAIPTDASAPVDAGLAGPDAAAPGVDAYLPPLPGPDAAMSPDAEQCNGPDSSWFQDLLNSGRLPQGWDDAGIPYIYKCFRDVCHPVDYGDGGIPEYGADACSALFGCP